ncbi:hypothetical protein TcasGA2_TC000120 [Tribolium castaneum]|uniref:Uncharacterized protein n=1 Tax=Tribolium castaneum TaxID=7070 RepID=D6WDA7_TRICA|nr:hypothetical protein TcasGA2_TC000120 [Tribolium castaneum]
MRWTFPESGNWTCAVEIPDDISMSNWKRIAQVMFGYLAIESSGYVVGVVLTVIRVFRLKEPFNSSNRFSNGINEKNYWKQIRKICAIITTTMITRCIFVVVVIQKPLRLEKNSDNFK